MQRTRELCRPPFIPYWIGGLLALSCVLALSHHLILLPSFNGAESGPPEGRRGQILLATALPGAAIYFASGLLAWGLRWRGPELDQTPGRPFPTKQRIVILSAAALAFSSVVVVASWNLVGLSQGAGVRLAGAMPEWEAYWIWGVVLVGIFGVAAIVAAMMLVVPVLFAEGRSLSEGLRYGVSLARRNWFLLLSVTVLTSIPQMILNTLPDLLASSAGAQPLLAWLYSHPLVWAVGQVLLVETPMAAIKVLLAALVYEQIYRPERSVTLEENLVGIFR